MKVNNQNVKSGVQATNVASANATSRAKADNKADKNAPVSAESIAGSAKVNVSERTQMMQKAKEIASADTIDEAKVARLQSLIDSGKYKVDAAAVADRLVDEHLAAGE